MINRIKKNFLFFKKRENLKGFTSVETLVAISILMLAVTGPLYFASESLKAATYARDQITAFYLAQDAFEQIRKIRDDNLNNNNEWNLGLTGCESGCRVAVDANGFYKIDNSNGDTYLYRNADTGIYSHDSSGVKTSFKRVVKIEPTDGKPAPDIWTNATEMKVTVTISWKSGTIDREFPAYEFLRKLGS